jgi:ribosome maturation factor RimP
VKDIEKRVKQLVQEKIAGQPDLFIVDIRLHPNGKLVVLLDGDNGVTIQDCAAVSRYLGFHLEEENLISDAYTIEVSSPGIDAPLKSGRQYRKNIGRTVRVMLTDGSKKEGRLLETAADAIQIEEQIKVKGKKAVTEQSTIPFNHIAETKVLISFK